MWLANVRKIPVVDTIGRDVLAVCPPYADSVSMVEWPLWGPTYHFVESKYSVFESNIERPEWASLLRFSSLANVSGTRRIDYGSFAQALAAMQSRGTIGDCDRGLYLYHAGCL